MEKSISENKHDGLISRSFYAKRSIYQFARDRFFETTKKQNFKKTSWKKVLYSCGGYGGRCGGCKHGWIDEQRDQDKKIINRGFKDMMERKYIYMLD